MTTFNRTDDDPVDPTLRGKLKRLIGAMPNWWALNQYIPHFTVQNAILSERIARQPLSQLARLVPGGINDDEIYILLASAWLYEVGMQSRDLAPVLGPNVDILSLNDEQKQRIRRRKHDLTRTMILESTQPTYPYNRLPIEQDEHTQAIALVCGACSDEIPIETVEPVRIVNGVKVRTGLLIALLRLTDQLYYDTIRVRSDMLIASELSLAEKTRWWMHNYAQTLPIENGQILFNYALPPNHKQWVGHIAGLVERQFEADRNSLIRFLANQYRMNLIILSPYKFAIDEAANFHPVLPQEMIAHLRREVEPKPIPEDKEPGGTGTTSLNIAVLDYENFLLQLGHEGHFLTTQTASDAILNLLVAITNEFTVGRWDYLAVGHWDRPELRDAANKLKPLLFDLLTIPEGQTSAEVLQRELDGRLSHSLHSYMVFLAPPPFMQNWIREHSNLQQKIYTWITKSEVARVYRVLNPDSKYLGDLLHTDPVSTDTIGLSTWRRATILYLLAEQCYKAVQNIPAALQMLKISLGNPEWWYLWLSSENVINQAGQLNERHEEVAAARRWLDQAIAALNTKPSGIPLTSLPKIESPEIIFHALSAANLVYTSDDLWQINQHHPCVLLKDDRYNALIILGIDHFLVGRGYPEMHAHTLANELGVLHDSTIIDVVVQHLTQTGLIIRKTTDKKLLNRDDFIVSLQLNHEKQEIMQTMLNRDILLDRLYRRQGMTRTELETDIRTIRSFTVKPEELPDWIEMLKQQGVIRFENERICLNQDNQLFQRLWGRRYIYGMVKSMRIMKASRPDSRKSWQEVADNLKKYVKGVDAKVAPWTLEYARSIKLLDVENRNGTDYINLARHSFLRRLDESENNVLNEIKKILAGNRNQMREHQLGQKMGDNLALFGYSREAHEYWIDLAIHRKIMLREGPRSEAVIRLVG